MVEIFPHKIKNSEAKHKYVIKEPTGKNSQSGFQLGVDLKKYLFNNDILEKIDSKNQEHNLYKLKSDYKVVLSENIKSFLNYQYVPENFDVVFSEIIKTNKFDLKRSANRQHNNHWVVELYDKCTSNDLINISVDTDAKLISFDIILEHPRALAKDIFEMPRQLIYFGAPGTGKSYSLNKDAHIFDPKNIRRVTFHPSLLYNEFVGGFKPFPTNDVNVPINYYYIPGTLIKSLVDAIKNPSQTYLIIIEELNRANVSAVFGEMFQLLDRDSGGRSQYPIDISEDLKLYLNQEIFNNKNISDDLLKEIKSILTNGLVFPENLFIWATMNNADQGVMPLDTAFKRRWSFKYFSIDQAVDEDIFETFCKVNLPNNQQIPWNDIRVFINDLLSQLNVPEDKLLGPYFISKKILTSSNELLTEEFKSKVLMYLFEDVGVHFRNKIFNLDVLRYSEVLKQFDIQGINIFNSNNLIEDKIINLKDNLDS